MLTSSGRPVLMELGRKCPNDCRRNVSSAFASALYLYPPSPSKPTSTMFTSSGRTNGASCLSCSSACALLCTSPRTFSKRACVHLPPLDCDGDALVPLPAGVFSGPVDAL